MREAILKARDKQPFEPFEIELVGGTLLPVPHPEFVYVTPGKSMYFVWCDEDGTPAFYNAVLVVAVRPVKSSRGHRRKAS